MPSRALPPVKRPSVSRRDPSDLDPEIRRLLGPPALHDGESEEDYNHLHERLRSAVLPADVIEELWVRDVADLAWEALRLRRLKAKLMDGAAAAGLERVLTDLVPDYFVRETLLKAWVHREAAARRQVDSLLAKAGLDRGTIEAQTLSARLNAFERIDRLIMLSEARRNAALREIDRHRDAVARRLREAMADIEDVEFQEVSARAAAK